MSMCCKGKRDRDDAVSELVGEMLMLTIVLILLAIFSATASNYLPPPRDPSVTIMTDWVPNGSDNIDIHLYYKGGDWIKKSDMTVIISENQKSTIWKYPYNNESFCLEPDSQSFDLGDRIVISHVPRASYEVPRASYEVLLVTPRAVVFSGEV